MRRDGTDRRRTGTIDGAIDDDALVAAPAGEADLGGAVAQLDRADPTGGEQDLAALGGALGSEHDPIVRRPPPGDEWQERR